MKANLGCGNTIIPEWDNVDILYTDPIKSPSWTVGLSAEEYLKTLPEGVLTEVRAHHILEHISDLDGFMFDLWRATANGCKVDIIVPLANTLWDVADPTHKRRFNHKTLQYYCVDFETSYQRPKLYRMLYQKLERYNNEWFDGIEWIVANLKVVLETVK